MSELIQHYEAPLRLGIFLVLLVSLLVLEIYFPRRHEVKRYLRWQVNLGLGFINMVLARLILPLSLSAFAALHYHPASYLGFVGQLIVHLIMLDFIIYMQHRLFHKIPFLWRFHLPHHSDRALDVSSALRFHPLEILISYAIKLAAIWSLNIHPASVIIFEMLLNGMAMLSHSNWNLGRADRLLRWLIVTPDMHRIHHSTRQDDDKSNFGFCLSIWDRLFATYQQKSEPHQEAMEIGLPETISDCNLTERLDDIMLYPFRKQS